jgi:RNA polymerase sigma-70 factor, ECF subfamily
MNATPTSATARERKLLGEARAGDEDAFRRLVEPHRPELHAHCYRMLGSVHDAEDALQDALLRAWRGLAKFEGRSSLRSWLYRIATNTCLDAIARRPKRMLPVDYGPAADPHDDLSEPLVESQWVEPYPDERLGLEDGYAAPEARYEQRESVELAFIAALQHLPAHQRAALILRDVLGFSAREVAESLETTVASVNGALRRARKAVEERLPAQSQLATLRALGDDDLRALVERYVDAWERGDVDAILSMLADDATFTMPPLRSWYRGRDDIAVFLRDSALQDQWRFVPVRANGQLAFGTYAWDADRGSYTPLGLDVLTLRGARVQEVTAFVVPATSGPDRERFAADVLDRFGLPDRVD